MPKSTFIELGDLFDEDETFFPYLKMNFLGLGVLLAFCAFVSSCVLKISATLMAPKTFGVFSVVNSLKVMLFICNASNKLKTLNYDTHDVPCFLVKFNSDVLFEFPSLCPPRHLGQM